MMEVHRIDASCRDALCLPNDPFLMPGRLIVSVQDGVWGYREQLFPEPKSMVFPEEAYDLTQIDADGGAFGAYENGHCVGIAVYQKHFFAYLHLLDLKVSASARGKGAGKALLKAGEGFARELGYRGIFLEAQDDNLEACRFYLHCGFQIGGFNNRVYHGTSQEGKSDILFYYDFA